MFPTLLAPLMETLRPHFGLCKRRLVTLSVLMVGLVNCRTVNLSYLASQYTGRALHASNYRRLQRFFQFVRLDGDAAALLVVRVLGIGVRGRSSWLLALDRTNWKFGGRDVNMLVLAVVTNRFRVPLMWTLLDHGGGSSTAQRIALMRRYLRLFGAGSIRALLADREFVGADWMKFLCENKVPFVIRLKEDLLVRLDDGRQLTFKSLLRKRRGGAWRGWFGDACTGAPLRFAAKCIRGGETLIVAANIPEPTNPLNLYRRRWSIECLFADAKSRGLNLEDTHITDCEKLSTLLVVVTLALTWAYRCATRVRGRAPIRRKTHGRPEKSWFRLGFDALRKWIIHDPDKAIDAWRRYCPSQPLKPMCQP